MYENLIRVERNTPDKYTIVEWTLGNKCTYACSYCPEVLHDGSAGWHDHTKLTGFLDACYQHYKVDMGKKMIVQYTGGEPTVYPKFKELVSHARDLGILQSIISNGSRTVRFWREAAPLLDKVHLSYHGEFADPDHFVAVAEEIAKHTDLHVNMLMIPGRFGEFLSVANRIKQLPDINIQLKPIQKDFGADLYDYTEGEKRILDEMHGFENSAPRNRGYPSGQLVVTHRDGTTEKTVSNSLILAGANRFKGWNCNIGVETLNVDMWGEIYGGLCRVGGSHGNIYKGEYTLPSSPVVCNLDCCTCHLDIMVSKSEGPL